jgi:hypothetical protein
MPTTRRQFLTSAALTTTSLAFLNRLTPVSAADAQLRPNDLNPDNGIESTLRLLEETPREKLLEEVATRIKNQSLSYRELLASLLVAGVRNIQPRPQVGFKFHAVLVINSAHLASLASPDADRWLPIFWALDRFKSAQLETMKTSGWRMSPVNEDKLPAASKARQAFIQAMETWDEPAADLAAAALARHASRNECFELFARYGARDFRDIGHKAIYVANSFRTLDAIGWQHAQPVLRSLAYALLKYDGENPSKSDQPADRPGRRNAELVKKIRPDWQDAKPAADATATFLKNLRTQSDQDACAAVVEALNDGVSPSSIWDALLASSAEMLMRKTNIVTLHAVTSSNALRFAYETSADPQLRLTLLLQNAAFVPLFRSAAGKLNDKQLDTMQPAEAPKDAAEIFNTKDRQTAAAKALAWLKDPTHANDLITQARRLVFLKGNDAHDYKFSSAVLEDYYHLAPQWRDHYLATALYYLPIAQSPDTPLVNRIRAALA